MMQTSSDPGLFWGASLKIKRAYKHIQEIEDWHRSLSQHHVDACRAHPNAGEAGHVIRVNWPPFYIYEEIGTTLGDAVHNLRSALDHAAAEIVGRRGGDISRLYFPMNDTWNALVKTAEYRLIQRHAPDIARIISDEIKPYRYGGEAGFYGLNQLDREDKHRLLIMMTGVQSFTHKIILDEDDPPPAGRGTAFLVFDRQGKEQAITPGSAADLHNKQYGYPTLDICFGKTEPFQDEPIIPTLTQLAGLVSRAIETLTRAELKNLRGQAEGSLSSGM